jgi:hypothetical protein
MEKIVLKAIGENPKLLKDFLHNLKSKSESDLDDPKLASIVTEIMSNDALKFQMLQFAGQQRTLDAKIQALNKVITDLYNTLYVVVSLDQGQSEQLRACVAREIPKVMEEHPEFSREQAIAVGFSKCRKRLGISEPK